MTYTDHKKTEHSWQTGGVTIDGKHYRSWSNAGEILGVNEKSLRNNLNKYPEIPHNLIIKWLQNKIRIKTPLKDPLGNWFPSILAMAKEYGKNPITLTAALRKGAPIKEALASICTRTQYVTDHLGNKYPSLTEMCKTYELDLSTYNKRLKRGMTQKEALDPKSRITCYDHKGNGYASITEMTKAYGKKAYTVQSRLNNGKSLKEALETPVRQWSVVTDFKGNIYQSELHMCETYNISYHAYKSRITYGWPQKCALLYPAKKKSYYDHEGRCFATLRDMCNYWGITETTYYSRRNKRKMSLKQTLTTPMKKSLKPGDEFILSCGLKAKVLSSKKDRITYIAEDGTTHETRSYDALHGKAGHPLLWKQKGIIYEFQGFTAKYSDTIDNEVFYKCNCNICHAQEVFTPQKMIEHARNHKDASHISPNITTN